MKKIPPEGVTLKTLCTKVIMTLADAGSGSLQGGIFISARSFGDGTRGLIEIAQ